MTPWALAQKGAKSVQIFEPTDDGKDEKVDRDRNAPGSTGEIFSDDFDAVDGFFLVENVSKMYPLVN